ncbi:hypothetical protein EG329_007300 [Mollisiaceae sp. DMI_Dod_QoI]|nr:hypothetical protein EG329_007300 [Helotiales sp. DMI_Dod_QoI]
MASSAEAPTSPPSIDWKTAGVRVIPADSLDTNTAQTPGMQRAAAINFARVGAQKLWAGTVTISPNAKTGAHHHGHLESVIYVLKGKARMRWGERLEYVAEAGPGDFIFVPPYVPHQEINALEGEALECVLMRSDGEAVAVNLPDLVPVENPEGVKHSKLVSGGDNQKGRFYGWKAEDPARRGASFKAKSNYINEPPARITAPQRDDQARETKMAKQKKSKGSGSGPEKVESKPPSPKIRPLSLTLIPKTKPHRPRPLSVESPPARVIVHLMRHAEAQKKTDIFGPKLKDPDLSDVGRAQCSTFAKEFKDHQSHVTHILCSPMKRAINTAIAAFPDVVGKSLTVVAMPELQSLDKGPGGVGAGFTKLSKKYRVKEGEVAKVDVTTFGRSGWNDKDHGAWSPSGAHWRVDFIKGFLRGLLAAATDKIIEVVIISHRSFLKQLCKNAKTGFMVNNTCALFQNGELRSIGDRELKRLRNGEPLSPGIMDDSPKEENG